MHLLPNLSVALDDDGGLMAPNQGTRQCSHKLHFTRYKRNREGKSLSPSALQTSATPSRTSARTSSDAAMPTRRRPCSTAVDFPLQIASLINPLASSSDALLQRSVFIDTELGATSRTRASLIRHSIICFYPQRKQFRSEVVAFCSFVLINLVCAAQ